MSQPPNRKNFPTGCFLPQHALSVHPHGGAHFCLSSRLPGRESLEAVQADRRDVNSIFAGGQWPDSCSRCSRKEDQGIQSRRTYTWKRKEKLYGSGISGLRDSGEAGPSLRHIDLSFSNSCNLACAMCSSEFSTGWIRHDQRAVGEGLVFREFTRAFQKPARIRPALTAEIMSRIQDIDMIIIKGGEPTLDAGCLEFLGELSELKGRRPVVFIQTNGTISPARWLEGLEGLELDVGISMDGWGAVFDWIRGPFFEKVIENLRQLENHPNVRNVSVNFTLSAFNVLHLPEFLGQMNLLRAGLTKLRSCNVWSWAQEPYASPLALPEDARLEILERIQPILNGAGPFFLDHEILAGVLRRPRLSPPEVRKAYKWYQFMNEVRGFGLGGTSRYLERLLSEVGRPGDEVRTDLSLR